METLKYNFHMINYCFSANQNFFLIIWFFLKILFEKKFMPRARSQVATKCCWSDKILSHFLACRNFIFMCFVLSVAWKWIKKVMWKCESTLYWKKEIRRQLVWHQDFNVGWPYHLFSSNLGFFKRKYFSFWVYLIIFKSSDNIL